MKGVAWDGVGAPQLESAKKAGELISDVSMCVTAARSGSAVLLLCSYLTSVTV